MTSPPAVRPYRPEDHDALHGMRIRTAHSGGDSPRRRGPDVFPAPTGPPSTPDGASRAGGHGRALTRTFLRAPHTGGDPAVPPLTPTSRYSPHGGQDVAGSHLPDHSDMLEARVTQQRDMAGQGEVVALAAGAPAVIPS